jgi:DNA-binding XRE family transcriptional regulator
VITIPLGLRFPLMYVDRLARLTRAYRLGRPLDETSNVSLGRLLRQQSGVSLREMARVIGVNQGELSNWERGNARPRAELALKWLAAVEAIEAELACRELEVATG